MTGQDSIALRMKIYVYDRKNVLKKEKRGRVGENEKNRSANFLHVHVAAPVIWGLGLANRFKCFP